MRISENRIQIYLLRADPGSPEAAEVDGDGDIDICTKPWNGNLHFYLRNMLTEDRKGTI